MISEEMMIDESIKLYCDLFLDELESSSDGYMYHWEFDEIFDIDFSDEVLRRLVENNLIVFVDERWYEKI